MYILHDVKLGNGSEHRHRQGGLTMTLVPLSCSTNGLVEGKLLHAHIVKAGTNVSGEHPRADVWKLCSEDAQRVFDNLRERNVFSWNIMMAAYAQNGHLQEARALFDGMPQRNVCFLECHACGTRPEWSFGGCKKAGPCAVVAAHAQNGHPEDTKRMFDTMPERFLQCHIGSMWAGVRVPAALTREGIQLNNITFSSAVDTSSSLESECGMEDNITVATALVRIPEAWMTSTLWKPGILIVNIMCFIT